MPLPEDRLKEMETRFEDIERKLGDPAMGARPDELKNLGKEHAELRDVVQMWRDHRAASNDLQEAKDLQRDASGEEREYIEEEIASLSSKLDELERRLARELAPRDPNDERDVIMEIRAGAGATRQGSSPPTSTACTHAMRRIGDGRPRS